MTTPLTLRSAKGAPLTHDEVDANFTALRATADAATAGDVVRPLATDLTLYVRADGNDANDGLTDSAGGAFLTIQRAAYECLRYVGREFYDAGIIIEVGAGTYAEYVVFAGSRTASGRTILVNGPSAEIAGSLTAIGVSVEVSGLTITDGSLSAYSNGYIRATCTLVRSYLEATSGGGIFADDCTFSGDTYFAAYAYWGGRVSVGLTTFSGTPDYSEAFAWCETGALIQFTDTLTGAATGKKFNVAKNGVIEATSGDLTYLPGDVAGTAESGGRYFYDTGALPPVAAGDYVDTTGDTMTGTLAFGFGTITANTPAWSATQEWNAGGVVFKALKLDVTVTAADNTSAFIECTAYGSTRFSVHPYGGFVCLYPGLNANSAPGNGFGTDAGLVVYGNNSNPFDSSSARAMVVRSPDVLFNQNGVFRFGDNWSSYTYDVGIGRNAAGVLEVNSGVLGTLRDIATRYVGTEPTTVASLPAAAAGNKGFRAFVTDATATAFLSTVAGGGANNVPVVSDGTNWVIG